MKKIVSIAVLLAGLAGGIGFAQEAAADVQAEKAVIARVIDASIGWFKNKDFDLLFRTMADDPELFFFSPDSQSTVHGIEAFRQLSKIWRDPANQYLSHAVSDLRIQLARCGSVAWWSAMLEDCGDYGGQVGCWKDTRWTGVVEKREGRWVVVQQHFSFASDQVAARVKKTLLEKLEKEKQEKEKPEKQE